MGHRRPLAWLTFPANRWQTNEAWNVLLRRVGSLPTSSEQSGSLADCLARGAKQLERSPQTVTMCAPARLCYAARAPLRWQLTFQPVRRKDRLLGAVCRLQLCESWRGYAGKGAVVPWFLPAQGLHLADSGGHGASPVPARALPGESAGCPAAEPVSQATPGLSAAAPAPADGHHPLGFLRRNVHPADRDKAVAELEAALLLQQRFAVDCRLRLPQGGYHWHRIVGAPEHDAHGHLIGWVGGSQNRHEHSATCRMRRTFLRLASHELNTPLTSLTLNLQLALARSVKLAAQQAANVGTQESLHAHVGSGSAASNCANAAGATPPPGTDMTGLLSRALREAKRLSTTVQSLLDVQCLMANALPLERAAVDLRDLLHEALNVLEPTLLQAGCRVTFDVPDAMPGLFDSTRMRQVFCHLLSNVAKFAAGSHVLIRGVVRHGELDVVVEDDGPGIAKEAQRQIFHLFGRGDAGRSTSGLGLGLYVCRRIVRAHGGRLTLGTAPGQGAHFTLTFARGASVPAPHKDPEGPSLHQGRATTARLPELRSHS